MMFKLRMILLIIFSQFYIAKACDCETKNIEVEKKLATEILVGRVVAKKINHQARFNWTEIGGIRNDIEIITAIKGDMYSLDTIQILTGNLDNSCGFKFELDQVYLIYARHGFTNKCRRTRVISTFDDKEIRSLLNLEEYPPRPPLIKKDQTSLTEKQYYKFLNEYPIITIEDCELVEDFAKCNYEVSKEVSYYFTSKIDKRRIKQLLVLYISETGNISSYKRYSKEGELTANEENLIIGFIEGRYKFISKGYGEIMSSGIFNILLEN